MHAEMACSTWIKEGASDMDRQSYDEILGPEATATAEALRKETPRPFSDIEGVMSSVEGQVMRELPIVSPSVGFVSPEAGIVQAGNPSPGLVRSLLNLVDKTRASVRDALTRTLAEAQADAGALARSPVAGNDASDKVSITTDESATLAGETSANRGRELVASAIEGVRRDRSRLGPYGKFVTDGALVSPQGKAVGVGPVSSLAGRLLAIGAIAGMAVTIPDGAAYADWYRKHRRDDGRKAAIAAGVGIIAGLAAGRAIAGQGGYAPYNAYGNGYAPNGYVPQRSYGYDSYGAVSPNRGYVPTALLPSDNFILAAKTLVAARMGSVRGADDVIDRALIAGRSCVQSMGPHPSCTVRSNGVVLDFANARYVATEMGRPVIAETQGVIQRIQPDVLQNAFFAAKEIKLREDYANGYGRGYGVPYRGF